MVSEDFMETLRSLPPVRWASVHPRLAAWIVLSVGMVILLVIEARDVGLLPGQWIALIVACVMVAGACIWIVSWEDPDEPEDSDEKPASTPSDKPTT
jgi:hypothetical protein